MRKSGRPEAVRLCPACHTGYILPSDLHPCCESGLSAEQAGLALTPQGTFTALRVVEGGGDGSWADCGGDTSMDEMKIILSNKLPDISDPLKGHGSDGLASSISGSPPCSPVFLLGEHDYGDGAPLSLSPLQPGAPPQWLSPSPQQSVSQIPAAKGLIQDLLGIIKKATDLGGIAMTAELPVPARGLLSEDVYNQELQAKRPPLWPLFTELQPFKEAAFSVPGKLRAPVSRYEPFTRVHWETEKGFPAFPPLEDSLASILYPKATFFGKRKPSPPTPRDQVYAGLSDRSHQCAAQITAAQNNVALLSSAVSAMATKPGALSPELATEIGKAMTAVLTLTTATTVAASRIRAWQTMMQRNIWLRMSQLPPLIR